MKLMPLLLLTGALGGADQEAAWQEPACRARVSIELPAVERPLRAAIEFSGGDFYRWTGVGRPAVSSLRLRGPQGPIALQVEERDPAGQLAVPGDGRLDDDESVLFTVELGPRRCKLWLYYDGPEAPAPGMAPAVQVVSQPREFCSLVLKSGELTIGLHGGGTAPGEHRMENFGRGALALVTWQGQTLADMRSNWGNYFPRTLASAKEAPPWSLPAVAAAGPVRTVVRMHCRGYRHEQAGKEVLTADLTHSIALWSGVAAVDFEQIVDYRAAALEFAWPYTAQYPVGRFQDEHDRLIVPLASQAHVVPLGQTREQVAASPWRRLYATDNPEEGWFAWQDTAEKTGLATFYEPMAAIDFRAAWVTYRPALHPDIHIRTTMWNAPETTLTFRDRALRCRGRYQCRLRYLFLRDESADAIRTLYHLWGRPLDQTATIGWPQTRP